MENLNTDYSNLSFLNGFLQYNAPYITNTDPNYWQNELPNPLLWNAAEHYGLPPIFLKALCMTESQCVLNPIGQYTSTPVFNNGAGGIMQVSALGGDTIFRNIPESPDAKIYYDNIYNYLNQTHSWLTPITPKDKYSDLTPEQKIIFQTATQTIYNGQCDKIEADVGMCALGEPLLSDMNNNINLGALGVVATNEVVITYIGNDTWNNLPNTATTQSLILAAGYKMGAYGAGGTVQQAQNLNNGQPPSWDQVAEQIAASDIKCSVDYQEKYNNPADCAANYAEKSLCYAESISLHTNVDCTLPSNWNNNWIK
jgi:hypothetical protein